MPDDLVPIVAVRLAEGRCGSTLVMQLLATAPGAVFDDRYPAEYRFLSYFARMSTMMTEPFDERRHAGVTPFFFGPDALWGPMPFESHIIDVPDLARPLLHQMWSAWSGAIRERHPGVSFYAEKIAVDLDQLCEASIPVRVIDLVRDPRDVLASIRAFTSASGVDGFGRTTGMSDREFVNVFVENYGRGLARMSATLPAGVERILVRYEDLVTDVLPESTRIGDWLGVELDSAVVEANRPRYAHHITSASSSESIGRWRDELDGAELRLIADGLGDLAGRFGYLL